MEENAAQIDPAAVGVLLGRLADTARDLHTAWQNVLTGIAEGEAAFGGDAVGQAIASAYRPAGDALREAAGQVPALMLGDAEVGERGVDNYRSADGRGQAALRSATVGGGDDARS
jgi:hypothetical protein